MEKDGILTLECKCDLARKDLKSCNKELSFSYTGDDQYFRDYAHDGVGIVTIAIKEKDVVQNASDIYYFDADAIDNLIEHLIKIKKRVKLKRAEVRKIEKLVKI